MKNMTPSKTQGTQKSEDESTVLTTTQYLIETVKQLQAEVDSLRLELGKAKSATSSRIATLFLVPGVALLSFSVYLNSPILAFVGLGLAFWGALFFLVKPIKYVKSSLLDSTAVASYSTIDRIIRDLGYKGKGYYIPPYPTEAYLPEYLKGLKEMIVFISADKGTSMPSIEEMAKRRFILENPKGICVVPPGLGLLSQFEREAKESIDGIELAELSETLPHTILANFQLAKEIEMHVEEKDVHLVIVDSIYKDLYLETGNLNSVHFLGCPLVSAVACALAKSTGKIVTIQDDRVSADGEKIDIWYRFVED